MWCSLEWYVYAHSFQGNVLLQKDLEVVSAVHPRWGSRTMLADPAQDEDSAFQYLQTHDLTGPSIPTMDGMTGNSGPFVSSTAHVSAMETSPVITAAVADMG